MIRIPPQVVAIEEGADGAFLAHGFTLPGCVAMGSSAEDAVEAWTVAMNDWLQFLSDAGEPTPPREVEIDVQVDEWVRTDARVLAGESTACFDADHEPMSREEIARAVRILGALRARILPWFRRSKDADLELMGTPELNVRLILDELARASWWILTRLGASPLGEVPERVISRLDTSMALVVTRLTEIDEATLEGSIEIEGEEWTVRKVVRRLLWLEWTLGGAALDALSIEQAPTS